MTPYCSKTIKKHREGAPIENTTNAAAAANAKERKLKVKPSFTNSLLI